MFKELILPSLYILMCNFADSQIVDMCLAKNESSHFHQPVYLTASDPNCTCSLNGSVTRVKILQSISIELLIQSKDNNIFGIHDFI